MDIDAVVVPVETTAASSEPAVIDAKVSCVVLFDFDGVLVHADSFGLFMRDRYKRSLLRKLLVLPMYPQYSATSSGSVIDAVMDTYKKLRWPPELRLINDYHNDPAHIDALVTSIERWWQVNGRGDKLLLSFHGIPERYLHAGDPYFCQCHATARLLRERLGMTEDKLVISFQSRVGRERWLHPYTDQIVRKLAAEGVKSLDVACPGFSVDCLETLEEIAMQNRDFFIEAGGSTLW